MEHTTGASAGTSCMHDELNSRNPGEAKNIPDAIAAGPNPFVLRMIRKNDDSRSAPATILGKRAARIERGNTRESSVIKNVSSGG